MDHQIQSKDQSEAPREAAKWEFAKSSSRESLAVEERKAETLKKTQNQRRTQEMT